MKECDPMIDLKSLRWTTRREVCGQLCQALLAETSATDRLAAEECAERSQRREDAARLLALIADGACVPALRHLLLDGRETTWTRSQAGGALVRLGAQLRAEDLPVCCDLSFFGSLLPLFHTDEAWPAVQEMLAGWTPLDRTQLLGKIGSDLDEVAPPIADWIYRGWLDADRHLVEDALEVHGVVFRGAARKTEPLNAWIAWQTSDRPESQTLLLEYWRGAEGEWRAELRDRLWDCDDGVPAACLTGNLEELQELAEALRLTNVDLVAHLGAESLMARAQTKFRAISRRRHADPSDWGAIHDEPEFNRMAHLMAGWPEPDRAERLRSLFCCPDIETEVRWWICHHLWDEQRAETLFLAQAAAKQTGDRELAERVLRWVAEAPVPADRDFLRWGAWHEERTRLPYYALQALEALGESGSAWRARLEALSRSEDPFLRLQAAGALVGHGDEGRLPEIVYAAMTDQDACVRGEAIRVLGMLRREEHGSLFEQALWAPEPRYVPDRPAEEREKTEEAWEEPPFIPAAEEAALALARLGSPAALTALVQASVFHPDREVCFQAERHLEGIIARLDGRDEPFYVMPWVGWRQEFFGRLP